MLGHLVLGPPETILRRSGAAWCSCATSKCENVWLVGLSVVLALDLRSIPSVGNHEPRSVLIVETAPDHSSANISPSGHDSSIFFVVEIVVDPWRFRLQ